MKYKEYLKKAQKRRELAFNLWHKGRSFTEIGKLLGVSRQRAHAMFKAVDRNA